jgi:hypothetical protein
MRLGQRNGKPTTAVATVPERTPLQLELAAVFSKVRGRSREERKTGQLSLLLTAMECAGIHRSIIDSVLFRARSVAGLGVDSKVLNDRQMADSVRSAISMTMPYFDPVILAQTGAKDLAILTGILIEKLQLLEGKPTQIMSTQERKHVNDLIPVLIQEAMRRGMDISKLLGTGPILTGEVKEATYTEIED